MIHGIQKIELTYASVQEALTDYLAKHFAPGVPVKVSEWKAEAAYGPGTQTVQVQFEQVPPKEPTDE